MTERKIERPDWKPGEYLILFNAPGISHGVDDEGRWYFETTDENGWLTLLSADPYIETLPLAATNTRTGTRHLKVEGDVVPPYGSEVTYQDGTTGHVVGHCPEYRAIEEGTDEVRWVSQTLFMSERERCIRAESEAAE